MSDHLLVAFDGGDSGTADLTWGQQDTFAAMRRENKSFSVGFWLPLADGTTVTAGARAKPPCGTGSGCC